MIYLVRQGQTDWNLLKKFNGRTETELNQTIFCPTSLKTKDGPSA
ncbi:MAG: histidine phosphatase family protein [Bacillota bacterium]